MRLNAIRHDGPDGRPPLLVAHGLFGSARNWNAVARRLARDRAVLAVDMRNHGASPWDDAHDYEALAGDLIETMDGVAHDLLGHSMGGKAAMVAALAAPGMVRRLVVADIAPVAYDHDQSHLVAAMRAVDLAEVERRSDASARMGSVPDDGTRAFLLQSLDVAGRRWTFNLDALEAEMAKIVGFPDVGGTYEAPALFLAGGASDYVSDDHADRIHALFPAARMERIDGAGHWLHAQEPRAFEAAVRAFLDG